MDVNPSWTEDMVGPQSEINLPFSSPPPLPDLLNRAGSMEISTSEDMLNKNFSFHKSDFDHCRSRRQSVPLDTSRKLFADENRSTQKASNIGNFYYKHCDTDDGNTESEQDERLMDMDSKNAEESSDEEWTFKCGGEGGEDSSAQNEASSLCQSTETLSPAPKTRQEMLPKDELKKLIDGAEPIAIHASPIRKSRDFSPLILDANRAKRKVNEWMSKAHPDDRKTQGESYDATWEYTTEEEERHSSGDFDTSVIHCSQSAETMPAMDSPVLEKASPSTVTSSTPDHFKVSPVVLRAKRKDVTTKRPLSESGLPQLSSGVDRLLQTRSESALNQMDHTPTQSVKMDTSVHGTLSSSTTVEEILCQTQEGSGGGYSSNSLRKRKIKLRKRNQGRKSDSGSDHREPPSPLKAVPMIRRVVTSGTETEEESEADKLRGVYRRPMFRLGPEGGPVTTFRVAPCGDKALSAESSLSTDQAWDSYQEKYVSEAYSEETADQETTRKLLDFGDDYRNFIDSQSDGASSLGLSQPYTTLKNGLRPGHTSSHRRRRQALDRDSPDHSDKESKEVSKIISHSLSSLEVCEESLTKLSSTNPHLILATDFNDILVKCKTNIEVLNSTMDCYVDTTWCVKECPEIKGLIEKWQGLEERSQQLQKMRSLQREMAKLKEELLEINERVSSTDHDDLQDRDQLQMKIFQIKGEQSVLRECKPRLVEVNTAVHKFFTDSGQHEVAARLKDAVKELYYVWEETNKRVTHRLESLNQVSAAWQIFECNLSELKAALLRDQQTLGLLDHALQQGPVSQDVASSVIDVAKVLSEKQDLCFQSVGTLTSSSVTQVSLSLPPSTEGSLSDSGISDSGSEQECERERRLSALRRLARQLESLLSPNSQAILDMTRRIEQAEVELRGLQETCRNLIVRTAASADAWQRQDLPPTNLPSQPDSTLVNRSKKNVSSGPQSFMELDPDDDPDPSKNSVGWLWRVIRAALPFQMAILAIFCVACLLEPHCCDSMNNLNFSLTPQLRYMRGPPPV